MALRFYNTLTQQVEEFRSGERQHGPQYTCVRRSTPSRISANFRRYFVDICRKTRRATGKLTLMNITDGDDKIIRTRRPRQDHRGVHGHYIQAFRDDCETCGWSGPSG